MINPNLLEAGANADEPEVFSLSDYSSPSKFPIVRKEGLYSEYEGKANTTYKDVLFLATDKKKLYYNGIDYTSGHLIFPKDDNGARGVYLLIADVTEWYNTPSGNVNKNWGIVGYMYGFRGGNITGTTAQTIVAWTSYNRAYKKLQTDNNQYVTPCVVLYENKYYIALYMTGSGHSHYFIGHQENLLSSFIQVPVNASGDASGLTVVFNGEGMEHYGNATSATQLHTARTLWGQSFNGESNVSGDMTGVGSITMDNTITTTRANKDIDLGLSVTSDGRTTQFINGKSGNRGIYDATNSRWALTIATDGNTHLLGGNVGIGTTSVTSGCKFDVNGVTKLRSYVLVDDAIQTAKGVTVNRTDINKDVNSTAYWYGLGLGDIDKGVTLGGYYGLKMFTASGKYTILENGRHGVNTDTPSCTFDVNGDCHAKRYNTDKAYWSDDESTLTPNSANNGLISLGKVDGRWKNIYTNGLDITSTTKIDNLNADYLDGLHSTSFARTDETPAVDINTYKKRAGFITTNMNSQATAARHYPIAEAGSLIYCESANERSNQIYGTYNTNRWYVRGAGINDYTPWRELEPVDGFLQEIDASNLDPDTWYPVTIQLNGSMRTRITIQGNSTGNANASWISRQDKGFSLSISWISIGSSWGWMYDQTTMRVVDQLSWGAGAESKPVRGIGQITSSSHEYVYIRGGAKYRFWTSNYVPVVLRSTEFTSNGTTIAPIANSNVSTLPEINLTHVYAEGNKTQKITGQKTFTGGYIKIENSLFFKEANTTTTDGIYFSPHPDGNLTISSHKNYVWQSNLGAISTNGDLGMTGNITASGSLKSSEYVELRGSKGYGYLSVKKDDTSSMPIDFGINTDGKSFVNLNTDKSTIIGNDSVEIKSPTIKIGNDDTYGGTATTVYQSNRIIPTGTPIEVNGGSSIALTANEPIAKIINISSASATIAGFTNLKIGVNYNFSLFIPANTITTLTINHGFPKVVINDVIKGKVISGTTNATIKIAASEPDCIMKVLRSPYKLYIEIIADTVS